MNNDIEQKLITEEQKGGDKISEQFLLSWDKINLSVSNKPLFGQTQTKNILNNVSGFARSGECLAIMGASGSGKSTLLKVLSNRLNLTHSTKFNGQIDLNGQKMSWSKFKNFIGFVMQRDLFFEDMTISEVFDFIIKLKPSIAETSNTNELLKDIIDDLKLENAQSNYVGGKFRKGISGGEKRRLSIGTELLANPRILFLDEPTSGLDSYTGYVIIKKLTQLARKKNMLIVYTIHQPSFEIYNLFDNLMVLNKGNVMYFGKKDEVVDYYANLGYVCPEKKLPADYVIDVSIKGGAEADSLFIKNYEERIQVDIQNTISSSEKRKINFKNKPAGYCTQFYQLSKRAFYNFVRNLFTFRIRMSQVIFIAILFFLLYGNLGEIDPTNPIGIVNRYGAFFFLVTSTLNLFFMSCLLICKVISSC